MKLEINQALINWNKNKLQAALVAECSLVSINGLIPASFALFALNLFFIYLRQQLQH